MKYYKVLNKDGTAHHGGRGRWNLPHGKQSAKWMPTIKDLLPCARGYHLCQRGDLVFWLGPAIWLAEGRGEKIREENKTVFAGARLIKRLDTWNDVTARLFAADCAERVLPLFESKYQGDDRPRKAIAAARAFARGEISKQDLVTARYAAGTAAGAAAWDAARDAARAAARDAAWAAAGAAAGAAENKWQTRRLFEYLNGRRTNGGRI